MESTMKLPKGYEIPKRSQPWSYWVGYWATTLFILATIAKFVWWIWSQPW
jgi:hydrogenase/urease accessory protein HupE